MGTRVLARVAGAPGGPTISATALDYNQIRLAFTEPPGTWWGHDVEISWDGGTTWHWRDRILTDALCLQHTGRTQDGVSVMAGFSSSTTYHLRMRSVFPDDTDEVFSPWSNVVSVATPTYRTGPIYPEREGGNGATVFQVANKTDWNTVKTLYRHGDFVEIAPGTVITGNYIYVEAPQPGGSADGFLTIRTTGYDHTPFVRASESDEAARGGVSSGVVNEPAFSWRYFADRVSVEGLVFRNDPAAVLSGGLVIQGYEGRQVNSVDTKEEMPYKAEFHGCLLLNDAANKRLNTDLMIGNAHYFRLCDSVLKAAYHSGNETHALLMVGGVSKFISNTFLSAHSILSLSGGSRTPYPHTMLGQVFSRCHGFKDPAWDPDPDYTNVKNLIEWKHGDWVRVTGCIWENNWNRGQQMSIVVTPTSYQLDEDAGTARLYFDYNVFSKMTGGFMLDVSDKGAGYSLRFRSETYVVRHNILDRLQHADWGIRKGSISFGFEVMGVKSGEIGNTDFYPRHLRIEHNTAINRNDNTDQDRDVGIYVILGAETWSDVVIRDNILYGANPTGLVVQREEGGSSGKTALDEFFGGGGYTYEYNAQYTESPPTTANPASSNDSAPSNYPFSGMQFFNESEGAGIDSQFVDFNGVNPDYSLAPGSTMKSAASDGTDIGADVAEVTRRTAHCVDGDWT